jgi:Na+/H+ antiporter NhaD/arsenite permease-like protein
VSNELGAHLELWTLAPFVCMLLAVAVLPLVAGSWYHRNQNKALVALVLGLPTVVYIITRFGRQGLEVAAATAEEYIAFIVLLFALYVISGGIYLTGNLLGTPRTNMAFLATGAVLANLIGTMGASMVLIRPVLRANSERKYGRHTAIFFIFVVSNIGGMLTPLGDPPLFLGFLRGVPFTWTLGLWPQWLLGVGLTLAVYAVLELYYYRKEPSEARRHDMADYVPMRLKGGTNLVLLVLVIVTILLSDLWLRLGESIHFPFVREVIMAILVVLSLTIAPRGPRKANSFTWGPINEVAIVFAGIFATMIPALALLQTHAQSIGLTRPWHYFWATGGLSAFLDNAPTYLAFASIAQGQVGAATLGDLTSSQIISGLGSSPAELLAAVSCGAVMMGALTYIGNAPNFTVKAIAEHSGLKMPSFLGYLGYALVVLVPILAIVTLVTFL